ncbi:hypothetical protein GCM10009527_060440 [Actinomadura nitritigenes]|uniref:DUF4407 domain-containing protein n=1 Tax=Actinomadura nitritigenes TaxID=134602 RepID=A0ABS3QYV6_9ACTN|nr:DUF4407 domain-containing protein [Actinomadura nitritigenes]MBO2439026.1 DUF4407 domain-containing protein [Actinomadura nitritigenes]
MAWEDEPGGHPRPPSGGAHGPPGEVPPPGVPDMGVPIPERSDGPGARAAVPRPRVLTPRARADVRAPDGPVEDVDERAEPLRADVLRRRAPGRLRALLRPNPPPTADRIPPVPSSGPLSPTGPVPPTERPVRAEHMTEASTPLPPPAPRGGGERFSPLLWASGVNRAILRQSPTDKSRFQGLGSVVIFTAALAGASMAAALHIALKAPWPVIVLLTAGWFLGILSLDRWLVASMTRTTSKWGVVFLALPRLALALLFGFVLSMPIVLQIFAPEISQEVNVLHAEAESKYQAQTADDQVGKRIDWLEKRKQQLEAQVTAGGLPATPDADPTLKQLQDKRDELQKQLEQRREKLTCEQLGKCGTGRAGLGPEARKRIQDYNDTKRDFDTADTQLKNYMAQLKTKGVQDAQNELNGQGGAEGVNAELTRLKKQQSALQEQHAADTRKSDGMALRLEALNRLSQKNGTIGTAHLFVTLMFIAIELLPVLVKMMQILGPPTVYDDLVAAHERENRETGAHLARRDADVARVRAADDVKYAGLVYDARRAMLESLAQRTAMAEGEVGEAALEEWKRREMARIPADLDRYVRTEPGYGAPMASGTPGGSAFGAPVAPANPGGIAFDPPVPPGNGGFPAGRPAPSGGGGFGGPSNVRLMNGRPGDPQYGAGAPGGGSGGPAPYGAAMPFGADRPGGAPGAGGDPMPFGESPNRNAAPYGGASPVGFGGGAGVPPRPSRFGPSGYEGHVRDATRQSRRDRLFGPLTNWWQDRRR